MPKTSPPLASFTLADHLDHEWTDELVGFPLPQGVAPDAALVILDERDQPIECQIAAHHGPCAAGVAAPHTNDTLPSNVNAQRVFFHVDRLPRLGQRTFRLVIRDKPAPDAVAAITRSTSLELSNGVIAVRLPASQSITDRTTIPGPVRSIRLAQGAWLGDSRLTLSAPINVDAIETTILESGPLWTRIAVAYLHEDQVKYRAVIRVQAQRGWVEVVEDSWFNHAAQWNLDLAPGLNPNLGFAHAHQYYAQSPARRHDIRRGERFNFGAITLPNYGGVYVPDDYLAFTLARDGGERVGVSGTHGASWLYPAENQIEINDSADAIAFNFPCKAGHRSWCLSVEPHAEGWQTNWPQTLAHRIIRRYDTPLDTVKDYVLDWSEKDTTRPSVMLTRDELPRLRAKAARIDSVRQYVERLDNSLPGEWFRYHSGTWGEQDPNSRADPPTAYLVTGDRTAALRTKEMILAGLRDRVDGFLSSTGNLTPSTGSYITLGRGLRPWVQIYDMVVGEGVFTDAEDRWFRAACAFFGHKIADRDYFPREALLYHSDHPRSIHRTHWFPNRESDYTYHNIDNLPHNFHMELYGTAIMLALAFPRHPCAAAWLEDSIALLDRELTDFVFPSGAWIESATYTFYTMGALVIPPMVALKRAGVRDFFADERFKRIFQFLANLITAPDPRVGHGAFPVLGDAGFPGFFAYVFNWVATLTQESDPVFAARMMDAWKRYGSQISPRQCQGLNYLDVLLVNDSVPAIAPPRLESQDLKGLGALLLRNQGLPDETYFIIKCGRIYSHFHGDEGAFILNAKGAPVMDEYGIQYGKGTSEQCRHNIVEFPGREVYNRGNVTTFHSHPFGDHVICEMPIHVLYCPPGMWQWGFKGEEGPFGWWRRHIYFAKPSDYFVIYDEIESPYRTTLHHHFKADAFDVMSGNRWRFRGRYGVDVSLLLLAERDLEHEMVDFNPIDRNPGQSNDPGWFRQWSVNVPGAPNEHFASLIVPHYPSQAVMLERIAGLTASKVTTAVVGEGATEEWAFLAPKAAAHRVGEVVYEGRAGSVRQCGHTITLTQMSGRLIGWQDVTIAGDGPFTATLTRDELRIELPDATKMVKARAPGRRITAASAYHDRVSDTGDGRALVRGG